MLKILKTYSLNSALITITEIEKTNENISETSGRNNWLIIIQPL